MKEKLSALILAFVLSFSAQAQELSTYSTWKDSAHYFIRELKQGAVIVRLRTKSAAIEKLRSAGNNTEANAVQQEQHEENITIMQAFQHEFDFCKAYFMFADSTDALISGRRQGFFLDSNLMVNRSIILKENFFVFADKGSPSVQSNSKSSNPAVLPSETGLVTDAIVLSQQNLKPFRSPFPYYAQEVFPATLFAHNWSAKVSALNKKLKKFYKSS